MTGTVLPDDWQPSEADIVYGLGLGLTTMQAIEIAEDMRLWAGANANRQIARKLNWSMAFRGWMRREAQKRGKAHGTSGTNATMDAFDTIISGSTGAGIEGGTEPKDITGGCGEVREAAHRPLAARKSPQSPSLFSWNNQDAAKVPHGRR